MSNVMTCTLVFRSLWQVYPIIVVTIAQGPQLHYQNNVLQSIEGRMIVIGYAAWRMMAQSILEIQKK